ncbi:hypothetical protein [Planococcus maritimus]|uniref:hypothetical protein n=1 Tax=Planococcus maritimus TaxID=192421 RepID=UPI0012EB6D12|nr:hypothetical protein [Planococcus maritimus]
MAEFLTSLLFTFVVLLVIFSVAYKFLLPEKRIINIKNLSIILGQALVITFMLTLI